MLSIYLFGCPPPIEWLHYKHVGFAVHSSHFPRVESSPSMPNRCGRRRSTSICWASGYKDDKRHPYIPSEVAGPSFSTALKTQFNTFIGGRERTTFSPKFVQQRIYLIKYFPKKTFPYLKRSFCLVFTFKSSYPLGICQIMDPTFSTAYPLERKFTDIPLVISLHITC